MKTRYNLTLSFTIALASSTSAQTIWNGPPITFIKPDFADHTLPVNQDAITAAVVLTRGAAQGLFNIAQESGYIFNESPVGTEWAFGTTADIGTLVFDDWQTTHGGNPPSMVDQPMVVHLLAEDIYIDITLLSWTTGDGNENPGGSGFSYERSSDPSTGMDAMASVPAINVFPNPLTGDVLHVFFNATGKDALHIEIFDLAGNLLLDQWQAPATSADPIDLARHQNGIYMLRVTQGQQRFVERVVLAR